MTFSFGNELEDLPKTPFRLEKRVLDLPSFICVLKIIRMYVRMFFAGDDTGGIFKFREDATALERGMRLICHTKQESVTHGLGLVLKKPKVDFKRINILSRYLALHSTGPVVMKLIPNLILLNATCSAKVNPA